MTAPETHGSSGEDLLCWGVPEGELLNVHMCVVAFSYIVKIVLCLNVFCKQL